MAVSVEQIIPWGRSASEYELMFKLDGQQMSARVLDCAGGPASFNAEMTARGHRVVSVDPLYRHSAKEIRSRFEITLPSIISQVRSTPDDWVWRYHRGVEDLEACRRKAMALFLSDYDAGLDEQRYVPKELPRLSFENAAFGLALCSHFLFLYSSLLSAEFHVRSILELCRVAREVRIFPLLALDRRFSPHVADVRTAARAQGWASEIVGVDYEFLRGANQMLRIFKL